MLRFPWELGAPWGGGLLPEGIRAPFSWWTKAFRPALYRRAGEGEPSGWQWAGLQRQRVSLLGGGEQQRTHGVASGTRCSSQCGRPSLGYPGCRFNVGKGASYRRLPLGPERLSDLSTSSRPRPTFHQFPSVTVAAVCPPGPASAGQVPGREPGPRDDSQWLSQRGRGCVCVGSRRGRKAQGCESRPRNSGVTLLWL